MEYTNLAYFEHIRFQSDAFPYHCFDIKKANTLPHWHNHMEIIYAKRGSSDVYVNGVLFSCSQEDFLIIPPGSLHSIDSKNSDYIAIVIGDTLLSSLDNDQHLSHLIKLFVAGNTFSPLYIAATNNSYSILKPVLITLIEEETTKDSYYEALIKSELCRLFVMLIRHFPNVLQLDANHQISSTQMMKTTLAYLSIHYHEKIMLSDMSELNHLSTQHFCRLFKAYTGKTFMEYLTLFRLDQAYKLLTATALPITRIPELTGFCNSNYFSRVYKTYFGQTPSATRKYYK